MKKIFFVIVLIVTISNLFAQTNKETIDITFEKIIHDYGTMVQGANGEYEFKFTNTSKLPLLLTTVSSSCGCTVPVWPKEPIQPGKSGSIKVIYDTNKIGSFSKTITVISSAKNSPVELKITGNVTSKGS